MDLLNEVTTNKEKKQCTLTVSCDLRKAFDVVRHDILLEKIKYYGIEDDIEYNWFKSYLTKRTQRFVIRDTMSTELLMETAVPQGSILGPVLFFDLYQ